MTMSEHLAEITERTAALPANFDYAAFGLRAASVVLASGHNLNSTATTGERSRFIGGILDAWNDTVKDHSR